MSFSDGIADAVVPGAPGDNTTLSAVLALYKEAGFASSWEITTAELLRCGICERESVPQAVSMHSLRRIEGASDPADMAAVLALTCPLCNAPGTLVMMYGPQMSAAESGVLGALRDRRSDDVVPAHGPPGESVSTVAGSGPPRLGDPAPDFAAASSTGHVLDLDAFIGKVPAVLTFVGDLDSGVAEAIDGELSWFGRHRVQALVVARCDVTAAEQARSSGRFRVPVLADPNRELETRYLGADAHVPATVVVSIDGNVVSQMAGGAAADHVARVKEAVELHILDY